MIIKRVLTVIAKTGLWLLPITLVFLAITLTYFNWDAEQREIRLAKNLAPDAGHFVALADELIFVQEMGPAEGQPVLFVHGTGAWSEAWKPTMQAMAVAGFHTVAIDLPPFGLSQRPEKANYDKFSQGQRIVQLIAAMQLNKVILVGHSFGGGPTMEAALQIPQKVKSVILVDAALSINVENETADVHAKSIVATMLHWQGLRNALVATFLTNPRFTRQLLIKFIDNPAHANDEWVKRYQYPLSVKGTTKSISEWLPELVAPRNVSTSEKPSIYGTVPFPIHLIWGALDSITPLSQAYAIQGLNENITLDIIKIVGHIPQIESPDEFNRQLLKQLQVIR